MSDRDAGEDADIEDPDLADLYEELRELEALVDSPAEREQVREAIDTALDVESRSVFGRVIYGFDPADAAEAFLGAFLFGIPMFVEGGTQEVGAFMAAQPLFFLLTNAIGVGLVVGILYVADIQDVRVAYRILGLVPRRLASVLLIAAGTAAVMMTIWGRVDWAAPWLTLCQISVAFVPMAVGAALGDILPGS